MPKFLGLVAMALFLITSFADALLQPRPASAASCRFVLGFQALHDGVPDVVGDCKVNEHYNPANGDALQETTKGMLVWRKADNFTAFTDGYRTWVNGPIGIQQRLNTERFEWERDSIPEQTPTPSGASVIRQYSQKNGDVIEEVTYWSDGRYTTRTVGMAPTPTPCYLRTADVSFSDFTPNYFDGSVFATGSIRNSCNSPVNVVVDFLAHRSKDGPPIVDGPSAYGTNIPAGATQTVRTRFPMVYGATWFSWRFYTVSEVKRCSTASRCLTVDPWLSSAYYDLLGMADMASLFDLAANNNVRIVRDTTDIGVLGKYSRATKTITIDTRLDAYSSWVRAAVISHELQHAGDDAAGPVVDSSASCYKAEESAFRREARVWAELWKNGLPPDVDTAHAELNDIALTVARDPVGFSLSLIRRYSAQCN